MKPSAYLFIGTVERNICEITGPALTPASGLLEVCAGRGVMKPSAYLFIGAVERNICETTGPALTPASGIKMGIESEVSDAINNEPMDIGAAAFPARWER